MNQNNDSDFPSANTAAYAPPSSTNGSVVVLAEPAQTSKKATRAGAPNYSADDISAMLDIVEAEEPLGANHWAVVGYRYKEWAKENSRPQRDQDSLKHKFDKLANMKKKTGDPSCPENVRRAKHIARSIHNKCAAMTLGDSDGDEEEGYFPVETSNGSGASSSISAETPTASADRDVIGVRRKKRKTAASGTPTKARTEQLLLEHIGSMTEHVGAISQSIKEQKNTATSITKEDVVAIVNKSMKPTHDMLQKMNDMLENLSSSAGT